MPSTSPFLREVIRLLATPAFARFADRLLPGEGEDLCQEIAMRAVAYEAGGGELPRSTTAWLHVVMRNEALHTIASRKSMRRTAAVDLAAAAEAPGLFPDRYLDAAAGIGAEAKVVHDLDARRDHRHLLDAIQQLPEPQREAIVATYFRGQAVRDQGHALGTVVVRIHRAKAKLRTAIDRSRLVANTRRTG